MLVMSCCYKVFKKIQCHSLAMVIILLFLCLSIKISYAKQASNSEIKASWISSITDWLYWKNRSKSSSPIICTVGRDKVFMHLKRIGVSNQNNIAIKNKAPRDNFGECHILYISNSEQEYYKDILNQTRKEKNIATISSIKGFARRGGMIEFVIQQKAHLIINLKVATSSMITIDDELYSWSKTIAK